MISVTILYPNAPDGRFDVDYWLKTHMPMSLRLLGGAIKSFSIERGIRGEASGSAPPYVALLHLVCESPEAFEAAFFPNAETLLGDMPNYTNIAPVIQISEIELSR